MRTKRNHVTEEEVYAELEVLDMLLVKHTISVREKLALRRVIALVETEPFWEKDDFEIEKLCYVDTDSMIKEK